MNTQVTLIDMSTLVLLDDVVLTVNVGGCCSTTSDAQADESSAEMCGSCCPCPPGCC